MISNIVTSNSLIGCCETLLDQHVKNGMITSENSSDTAQNKDDNDSKIARRRYASQCDEEISNCFNTRRLNLTVKGGYDKCNEDGNASKNIQKCRQA
jgi:hypothetical protein